jgi:HK97 family phage portal protein
MAKKLSIPQRFKAALTGKVDKSFIPRLPTDTDVDSALPLVTFSSKPEQLATNIGWVFAANRATVQPTVAVPLKLRRVKKLSDGTVEYEEIIKHDILDLLARPHLGINGKQLRTLNHTYLNLVGDCYALMRKAGVPFEMKQGQLPDSLEVLPAHLVQFKLGKERWSESVVRYNNVEYPLASVIRGFNPDPEMPYNGQSVVSAGASAIDVDQQMQSWNRRTFQNNARPGLVFNLTGENIDDDVYERLKQQMEELYTGDGAFRSLVVENGEVKPYMLSHQDLDFLDSRAFTRDEIFAMFTTPKSMAGLSDDYNRANIEGSRYIHILLNIIPRLEDEVAMWNSQLVQVYDPTLELYFENPLPEDVEAKLKEAAAGTNVWATIDETRAEYGLDPLPDHMGEQLIVPINSVPLSDVLKRNQGTSGTSDDDEEDEDDPDIDPDADVDDLDTPTSEGKKSLPKLAA